MDSCGRLSDCKMQEETVAEMVPENLKRLTTGEDEEEI
jgi:hypothetical protein